MKLITGFLIFTSLILSSCVDQTSQKEILNDDYQELITKENLELERTNEDMLQPILSLKSSDPKIYWFIVSWLNTNYRTPNWNNYNSTDWKKQTKERGIDCSGFARVMQQEVFRKKIRGGSQGILNTYCKRRDADELKMGDLVFFRAPKSRNDNIVHVGVYLKDRYFVHATSAKSAASGMGLMINSLDEKNWSEDFVVGGEVMNK